MRMLTQPSIKRLDRRNGRAHGMNIVVIGLSITSSWGNGHATTYRGLVRELARRGHQVLFLERDQPWYAGNRDMPQPPFCRTGLYNSLAELQERFARDVRKADVVIVGSYVPEGVSVGRWVTSIAEGIPAFYDIDTPVTLAKLKQGESEYLSPDLIRRYRIYLSFTGGPTLEQLQRQYGSPMARPLYCSVDPELYYPQPRACRWDLGYLGTYSSDRQPALDRLLLTPARKWPDGRFAVVGPQYPKSIEWPTNVRRIMHLPPAAHRAFYNAQAFTLNVTRADMICAGYSPSIRLFEAAACGVPIISDYWDGLETFLEPGREILIARDTDDVLRTVREMPKEQRLAMAQRARQRILATHTAAHRARQLEDYMLSLVSPKTRQDDR